jgi:hypothetical protein
MCRQAVAASPDGRAAIIDVARSTCTAIISAPTSSGALGTDRRGRQCGGLRLAGSRADEAAEGEHHQVEPPVAGAGDVPVEDADHLVGSGRA